MKYSVRFFGIIANKIRLIVADFNFLKINSSLSKWNYRFVHLMIFPFMVGNFCQYSCQNSLRNSQCSIIFHIFFNQIEDISNWTHFSPKILRNSKNLAQFSYFWIFLFVNFCLNIHIFPDFLPRNSFLSYHENLAIILHCSLAIHQVCCHFLFWSPPSNTDIITLFFFTTKLICTQVK